MAIKMTYTFSSKEKQSGFEISWSKAASLSVSLMGVLSSTDRYVHKHLYHGKDVVD